MLRVLRASCRLALWLAWTLLLIPLQATALALGGSAAERIPMFYHRVVCRIVGLHVTCLGRASAVRPTLFASNHTSYLDISVLSSLIPCSFVAKREVAEWPLFGLLAKLQRTVFIDRAGHRAAEQRDEMARRLALGDNLVLFPEGTSNDGNRVLPFRSALLSVAERRLDGEAVTVQPVSIAYSRLGGFRMMRYMRPYLAWYGDMELASHLWNVLRLEPVTVVVEFHTPVTIEQFGSRKALTAHCEQTVAAGVSTALHGRPARRAAAQ